MQLQVETTVYKDGAIGHDITEAQMTANTALSNSQAKYAVSNTSSSTGAKVAILNPSFANWQLFNGAEIFVKFDNRAYIEDETTTLTLTIKSSSTDTNAVAYPIKDSEGEVLPLRVYWKPNSTVHFMFDGTNWRVLDVVSASKYNSLITEVDNFNSTIGEHTEIITSLGETVEDHATMIDQTADSIISLAQGNTTYTNPETGESTSSLLGSKIIQTATSIESVVANNATYTAPDGTTKTNSIQSAIKQNADNINLKVSKNDVINQINVSTEGVQISADKVNIQGATIFESIPTKDEVVSDVTIEYGVGSSSSSHTDIDAKEEGTPGAWSPLTPTWTTDGYVWQRTTKTGYRYDNIHDTWVSEPVVTYACIQGAKGDTGTTIRSIEYSTDNINWWPTEPTLNQGDWLYIKTTYTDDTSSTTKSYIGTDGNDGTSVTILSSQKVNGVTTVTFSDGRTIQIEDGTDGSNGTPGTPGANGQTSYVHFAWTNTLAPNWDGFDVSDSVNKLYIGTYSDFTQADSTTPTDYSWTLTKGEKGEDGTTISEVVYSKDGSSWNSAVPSLSPGDWLYTKTIYSDTTEAISRSYIGRDGQDGVSTTILSNTKVDDTTTIIIRETYADGTYHDNTLTIVDGTDGTDGTPGTNGIDGTTYYTHFAWADGVNYTTNPITVTGFHKTNSEGKKYIGVYSDENEPDSDDPTEYSWTLIKGEKGDTGANGTSPTITSSYNSATKITTLTITDVNGQRQVEIRDGSDGGEGAEWFSGTILTHTSNTATATITGAKEGSMYINTTTCNVYKCTEVNDGVQTWLYIMCLAAENTIAKVEPIYTRTNSATAPARSTLPSRVLDDDPNLLPTPHPEDGEDTGMTTPIRWTLLHESRIAPPQSTSETTEQIATRLTWKYLWTCNQLIGTDGSLIGHTVIRADQGTTIIDGADITTGTITADQIAANAITADKIAANAITIGNMDSATQNDVLNSNIKVGGRNFVWDTEWTDVSNRWSTWGSPTTREIVTLNGKRWLHLVTTTTAYQGYSQNSSKRNDYGEVQAGDTFVGSFYGYAAVADQRGCIGIHWLNSSGSIVSQNWYNASLTTTAKRYVTPVWTVPSGAVGFNIMIGDNSTSACEIWLAEVKLEKGNTATEWTPAPEDAKNGISDAEKVARNYVTDISGTGIYISPANQSPSSGVEGNSVKIDGTGMEVFKGGISVAQYGDTARIGKADSGHATIESDGLHIWKNVETTSTNEVGKFTSAEMVLTHTSGNYITDTKIFSSSDLAYLTTAARSNYPLGGFIIKNTAGVEDIDTVLALSPEYSNVSSITSSTEMMLSVSAFDGLKLVSAGNERFSVSNTGSVSVRGYKLITTDSVSTTSSAISGGSYGDVTAAATKTGYTPIGIIGYTITGTSDIVPYQMYLNGTRAIAKLRNVGSSSYAPTVTFYVLYIASGQGI